MKFFKPLPFVREFVNALKVQQLKEGQKPLTRIQTMKLSFLLTAVILSSRLNLALFSRMAFGQYSEFALRWFLKHSHVAWAKLYRSALRVVFEKYQITKGRLVFDDTERIRANSTKDIFGVHRIKNKKNGGFNQAQEFVSTVLVTDEITVLIDLVPYLPDPKISKWKALDKKRKKDNKGKPPKEKKKPIPKPERTKGFPTKEEIAISSMFRFGCFFPEIEVTSILFDAAYHTRHLLNSCRRRYPDAQIASRLAKSQLVANRKGKYVRIDDSFKSVAFRSYRLKIRGQHDTQVEIKSARLPIRSLGRWEHVVAVRYKGQKDFRYFGATNLSWRAQDVVFEIEFRWLIEVVHEDWKLYEGYGRAATQRGYTGLECGLGLSSLVDTCLLTHPDQIRLAQSNQPLRTAGALVRKAESEFLVQTIESFLEFSNPKELLPALTSIIETLHEARCSRKHLSGVVLSNSSRDGP